MLRTLLQNTYFRNALLGNALLGNALLGNALLEWRASFLCVYAPWVHPTVVVGKVGCAERMRSAPMSLPRSGDDGSESVLKVRNISQVSIAGYVFDRIEALGIL